MHFGRNGPRLTQLVECLTVVGKHASLADIRMSPVQVRERGPTTTIVDSGGHTGRDPSIALDVADIPHIVYHSWGGSKLKYAPSIRQLPIG